MTLFMSYVYIVLILGAVCVTALFIEEFNNG